MSNKIIMDVSRWQGDIDLDEVKASGLVSGVMLRTRRTLMKSRSKEDIMASTTYRHLGYFTGMYAVQEQYRDITKMVTKRHHFAVLCNMVRNAGQLPQPFWIGAACGGGSCGAARCAART